MTSTHYEIVIVGAGPAGMAAAETAAEAGARTLVLDEQKNPGGQIYRAVESLNSVAFEDLDEAEKHGRLLTKQFRGCNVDYVPGATVWFVSAKPEIAYSRDGESHLIQTDQLILATGAQERPIPVPGWTLPGVMTAGAAQILLKRDGIALENAIFAGTGPLLYLAIHQYLKAGIPIKAVLDLTPRKNYLSALRHLPGVLSNFSKIFEGWRWRQEITRSHAQYIKWVSDIKILGKHSVTGISYRQDGHWKQISAQHILLHLGVVPNINISRVAGCETVWDDSQLSWKVRVDKWCRSSVPGIFVAGDGGDIGGAIAAEQRGRLAALQALRTLSRISASERDSKARSSRSILKKELMIRPFLESLFRPSVRFRLPEDSETIVCRCEEVTAGEIKKNVELGCKGPNQIKSYTRCGMGPCQGRFCGLTVSELIARQLEQPVSEVGYYRLRPPLKPLLLNELVTLQVNADQEGGAQ